MRPALLLPCLAFLLGGCAHLPRAHAPAPARPDGLRDLAGMAARAGLGKGAWPHTAWWTAARLPALNHLMTAALRDNPGLTAAFSRLMAARAEIRAAQSAEYPHIDAQALMTQAYFSRQGLHTTANGTHVLYTEVDPLLASYHVALWGRTRAGIRAAVGAEQVARAEQAQARLLLAARITWHYFALAGDRIRAQDLARTKRLQTQLLRLTRKRLQLGLTSASAFYRAERARAATAGALATVVADMRVERHILAALAGHGPRFGRGIVAVLPHRTHLVLPRDLPLALVTHRPDITAARAALAIAAARVGAARAAFYPDINIALFAGWNSVHLASLFSPGNLAHAIGPVITLPIFEGGLLRAHLRADGALYHAAQAHYRHTILKAVQQIADRLARWRAVSRRLHLQYASTQAAARLMVLARAAYRAGLTGRLAAIRAHITLLRARAQLAAAGTRNAQAWALLTSALGGGYHEDHHQ
ncbi:MAG: efflux transporter outer membrane subunit [Gammaproteobacteria bacterium]|nr:efflux transporter outer membrane subunit [Gammaproteobacteria bacterium]